jgi:hypothetical protein
VQTSEGVVSPHDRWGRRVRHGEDLQPPAEQVDVGDFSRHLQGVDRVGRLVARDLDRLAGIRDVDDLIPAPVLPTKT